MRIRSVSRRRRVILAGSVLVFSVGLSSAWAQLAVTDPATTMRNAATAAIKESILETLAEQHGRLRRMAQRLSLFTNLDKYSVTDPPRWRIHDFEPGGAFLYGSGYHGALNYGDATGTEFDRVARARRAVGSALAGLSATERDVIERALATLDLADSTIITGTHQTGQLRYNGRRELRAIDALEAHVIDPSLEQSATAVLDKISGAVLVETRQKQARLQFLSAIVEQLLVDNKRARDTEAAVMNMQLGRLRRADRGEDGGLLTGAGDELRTWRQP